MIVIILAVILSFVPSILLFLYLRNNRGNDEEYRKDCVSLLLQGFLVNLLVFAFDLVLKIPWNLIGIRDKYPWIDRLFTCFVVNALVEEVCKFLVANKFIKKNAEKVTRLDFISFITISAIGFALVEDVIFALSTNIVEIILRGILMGHVPYAFLMGTLYSKGIIEKKNLYKVLAFVLPILFHGSYNFLLSDGLPDWAALVVLAEVAVEFVYMVRMILSIKKKRVDPAYTTPILNSKELSEEI